MEGKHFNTLKFQIIFCVIFVTLHIIQATAPNGSGKDDLPNNGSGDFTGNGTARVMEWDSESGSSKTMFLGSVPGDQGFCDTCPPDHKCDIEAKRCEIIEK